MSIKSWGGKLLDWTGLANVPAALEALSNLKGEGGKLVGISAVDASGVATGFEAIEMPSGTDSGENVTIEPAEDDIPKVFFVGTAPTTKAEDELPLTMEYISKTKRIFSYVTLKVQGDSSAKYAKKNFNIKLFSDEARSEKQKVVFRDWLKTHKYCLKANWIDHTHARNVVNGRLWAQVVRSRADIADYPAEYQASPHCGAVDGFPVKVYLNGVYQGIYTWNIRKDSSMFNMDDETGTHAALIADANNQITVWRSLPSINGNDWTDELNDTVPDAVKTGFQNAYKFVMESTDEEFVASIGQYFYLSSLIDYFIYIYCILMYGGLAKSQTMFTYDAEKFLANIYDMDTTWALKWDGAGFYDVETPCPSGYSAEVEVGASNLLYERVVALLPDRIKGRYAELRNTVLSDANIINEFERFTDIISNDLYEEDYATTTAGGAFTGIPSKTTNNIQKLREIIVARLAYCDEQIPMIGVEIEEIPATGITLSATTLSFTESTPQTITATVEPSDTTDIVVWSSFDDAIAKVVDGVVTPVTNGSATITATAGSVSATCEVTVDIEEVVEDALYPLANGTYSTDDATVEVTNGNHVKITRYTPTDQIYTNISDCGANTDFTVASLSHEKWFGLTAGQSGELTLSNISNANAALVSINFKKANTTTSGNFGISNYTEEGDKTVTATISADVDYGCLFVLVNGANTVENLVVEFDVSFAVDGVKYI